MALLGQINARAGHLGPVPVDGPLVLYGGGNLGKLARAHLDAVGVPIALVVDAQAESVSRDPEWAGVRVAAPGEVPASRKRDALLAVSVVTTPFVPLQRTLLGSGWYRCVPFYDIAEGFRAQHPLGNGWFGKALDADDVRQFGAVLRAWGDDASRAHHLRFAAWRLCREEWDFAGAAVDPHNRFFIPEIVGALRGGERVLDAGAHHGTYTARFLAEAPGASASVWAIEPDPANRAMFTAWAATLASDMAARILLSDIVLGRRAETVCFHAGLGYASQIASTGRCWRETTPLDALALDPTVVKLHLEGGELAALAGASSMLAAARPIVMVTSYHNADGLIRIPLWLMQNLDRYRLLMRTHGWCGTGAVVYAIPEERL